MAKDEKKPNIFVRAGRAIGGFFGGIFGELKKVTWPTKKQVLINALSVLVFCVAVGIVIWLCDFGLQALMTALVG